MRFCFDLDGTICDTPCDPDGHNQRYWDALPIPFMVETVNRLYDEGHYIIIMTARGRGSGKNWTSQTEKSLKEWGVKYHELEPMFHKPNADLFIDDKGTNVFDWILGQPQKKGIIAGAFDVIHPGYIRMFADAKKYCNHLTIALHVDPSTERTYKLKPVQTAEERKEILLGIRNIDDVVFYDTEQQYLALLASGEYHMRFLGDDYSDGSYSGSDLDIPITWLSRDHEYSSTRLKTLIHDSIMPRRDEKYD